jgi:hypothetical protein
MKRTVSLLTTAVAAALVAACAAQAGLAANPKPIPGIRSPSGNIQCLFVPPSRGTSAPNLLCTIGHAVYTGALQRHCISQPIGLDWHGFELPATKKGAVTCSGGILYDPGTQRPTYAALPYGKTWHHGSFTCASRLTGVTCTNTRGHGLFLSRQSWRAW